MSLKSYIILFLSLALNANICISQNTDRQILEQGFTYEREGKYKKAIDTFARLHLDEQRLSVQTSVWNSLYKCNMAVGRYPMSNVYLRKLLSVVSNESSRDALWINLSDNQWSLGDYKSMLSSLDSVTNQGLTVTRRINALVAEGKYDQAIDRLDAYLSTSTNEEEKTIAIQNMGYVEWARGHLKIASDLINKALQRIPKSAENYPVVLSTYGYILGCNKEYTRGLETLNEALSIQKQSASIYNPDLLISLRKKGEIEILAGMTNDASKTFENYFKGERNYLLGTLSSLTPIQRLSYWAKEKPLLSKCFLLGDTSAEFLFNVAMFRRQTSLLGMRDTTELKKLIGVTAKDVRKCLGYNESAVEIVSYEDQKGVITYAAIILPKTGKARFVPLLSEEDLSQPCKVGSKSLLDAILNEDARDKNTLYTDTALGNRIWQPILKVLPHNTAKVYFAPEGIFHLLAVENLPFEGKERVELHRLTSIASLVNRSGEPKSERKSGKILIVGGLDYNKLPADSIKTEDNNREAAEYLIASGVAPTTGNLFANLKGTKKEVDSISSTLTNTSLRYEVDETLFKEIMPDYNIIHMATHGYCLNLGIKKRPEFLADSIPFDKSLIASGLALSGANIAMKNQGGQDELLSARELCDLDLSNVEFVVLSACQTAKGDITDEGPAGLVRGLKNAGVKTILATLWAVDDTSTMMFMLEFYKALECGKSKYQAYIQAQKFVQSYVEHIPYRKFSPKTMAKEKGVYYKERSFSLPYYWAPFILIDEF